MAKKFVVKYALSAALAAFAISYASNVTAVLAMPSAVPSSFEEGVRLYTQKQYKQALPVFLQFLKTNPRSPAAYLYIANSYYALQQVGPAKQTYQIDTAQRLDASISRDLAYYLQKSVAGQQECCGELFGIILGTEGEKSDKMKTAFPQTIKLLKAKLGV